ECPHRRALRPSGRPRSPPPGGPRGRRAGRATSAPRRSTRRHGPRPSALPVRAIRTAGPGRAPARVPSLLRPQAAKLLAGGLRAPPHLRDLDTPAAYLPHDELTGDAGVVEQAERAVHRRRRGGMSEAMGDEEPAVLVVVGVRPRVAGRQVEGAFHVA